MAAALLPAITFAQLSLVNLGESYVIDFDNNLSGVNNGLFTGIGFAPSPSSGALNSNAWAYTGMSSPSSLAFGGSAITGDAQRGVYDGISGGAAGGSPLQGFYAYKTNSTGAPADYCLGAFINGTTTITLKVKNNNTALSTINVVRLGYQAKFYNNRPDGTRVKVAYSTNNGSSYTDMGNLMEATSPVGISPKGWETSNRSLVVSNGINWAHGDDLLIQFTITKINNTGFADPVGIDNITVQGFDAKYVFDGNQWVTPPGAPSSATPDPTATALVLYGPSTATITSSSSLSTILVEAQAKLEITADLTVSDSAVLFANSNGYSQLIGEIVGKTRYQSYRTTTAGRWHNIAIPVSSTWDKVIGIPVQTTANPNTTNLWYYDAADTSGNLSDGTFKHISNKSTAPTDGVGYQLYAGDGTNFGSGPFLMEATGTVADGTLLINVVGNAAERFNIIPNPYPSTLEWEDVVFINSEVGVTYYVQDGEPDINPGDVTYREYTAGGSGVAGGTNNIPPGQSFFIEVDGSTDGTIEFRNTFRNVTGNTSLYKTTAIAGLIKLNTRELATDRQDETEIKFDANFSDNYSFREDGKNWMNTGYPNLYTHADGRDLVFNGQNEGFTGVKAVDLYFQGDHIGNYEMSITHDGLPAEWTVILEDKLLGTFTNIRKANYTYTHSAGANQDRFVLHFNKTGAVGLEELNETVVFSYVKNETLSVDLNTLKGPSITVFDITGKEVAKVSNGSGVVNFDVSSWAQGVYVVNVSYNGKLVHSNKVVH